MGSGPLTVPDDIEALKAALIVEAARAAHVEAELTVAWAKASDDQALIAHQKLHIAKLTRQLYGSRSERSSRLVDQIELRFEELESSATADEIAAERAVAKTTTVASFTRNRPARKPFPDHLPRERVIVPSPTSCQCCGGGRLRKLGEDVTETLESIPRQWKVIQHVREKFSCRDCEKISQAPAPFHVVARGWAGPSLLAMILFEKFGQHQPLNRQAERYAKEGVPLSLSTLADQVGAGCAALEPLLRRLEAHVFAAERLHGDDTTVPVLAKGKTDTGRCWVYVRDDRPFGGPVPPAAMFYYSRDRTGEHPRARSRRSPSRRSGASMLCSRSNARSAARVPSSAGSSGRNSAPLWSTIWKAGCASNAPSSRAVTIWPRRWTTCSNAGPRSPGSSTMGVSACPTTPPSGRYAASPWAGSLGCSPVPTAVDNAPLPCTASSSQPR